MIRLGERLYCKRITIKISVIGKYININRAVFRRGSCIINSHRWIIYRINRKGDRSSICAALTVTDSVGKAVTAIVVCIRSVV